jgi:hypothetical protein
MDGHLRLRQAPIQLQRLGARMSLWPPMGKTRLRSIDRRKCSYRLWERVFDALTAECRSALVPVGNLIRLASEAESRNVSGL